MTDATPANELVTGVVLAGGKATRMGGEDKGLIAIGGRQMISYVVSALAPQVKDVIINANRNTERYAELGYRVVGDSIEGYFGPLAGMSSAMQAADTPLIVTAPCDSPFVPADLTARLYDGLISDNAEISVAHDGERMQPVFTLLQTELLDSMRAYLEAGERKIDRWFAQHRCVTVDFSDQPATFLNVNTPDDIAAAEVRLRAAG